MLPSAENKSLLVPCLSSKTEIHPFSDGRYLLSHAELGYRILVSPQSFRLIKLVDGARTLDEICTLYSSNYDSKIDISAIYTLLYERLTKYGFIEQDGVVVEKRKRSSYLRLNLILLKSKHSDVIVRNLVFLFRPKNFGLILILLFGILTFTLITHFSLIIGAFKTIEAPNFLFCFIMYGVALIFHEIGHATACKYYGAKHGDIGFGFYLITPVLFADVSDIWKLKPKQRMTVNLAGLYFETIFACLLILAYYLTQNSAFLIIPTTIFISSLFNLNPLLRYDGYWILTDLLNVPNLRQTASLKANMLIKKIGKRTSFPFSKKDYFLAVYGLLSSLFIVFFITSTLLSSPSSVLLFPINVYNYFAGLFNGSINFYISDLYRFIMPLFFYILSYRLLKRYLFRFAWKKKK